MIPAHHLEADLRESLSRIAAAPLADLLLQHGILRRLAEDHLRRRLRDQVVFSAEEEPLVISRLWQGIATDPPANLAPGWIEALPAMLQGPVRERWDQIRLQKWMEETYRDQVEPYFLERRDDLEQVVYGMIRLRNQGAAEELYLRLLDDQADFGELARSHSLGEERFTRGLVGPMRISQPHATIRAALQTLAVGDLHPPFAVDNWILLVRMEHRQPARLNDSTQLQLCEELLRRDLDALLEAQLPQLHQALVAAWPGLAAAPAAGQGPEAPAAEQAALASLTAPSPAGDTDAPIGEAARAVSSAVQVEGPAGDVSTHG